MPLFESIATGGSSPNSGRDADRAAAAPLQAAREGVRRGGVDRRMLTMQVEKLDGSLPGGFANIPAAMVVAFMIRDVIPAGWLYLWIIAITAAIAGHFGAVRGPLPWRADRNWPKGGLRTRLASHIVFTTLLGAGWGGACLVLGPSLPPNMLMLLAVVILGCNAACIGALGNYLPAFFGFFIASLGPLAYATFERPEPDSHYLSVLTLIYMATVAINVRAYNRSVRAAFRLQSENEILAESVKQAQAQTAAETRSKWDMLAHLSHELRTPMNAIIGFSALMREQLFGPLGERYLGYCSHIGESGHHAVELIDAILDVSQAESGQISLTESEMPPSALVEECLRMVEIAAAAKRVTLDNRLGQSMPQVAGDRAKLRQALLNLLTNAIKYTPDGGRVTVDTLMAEDGLDIVVTDTGVGIASGDLERCLEPFVRLRNPLTAGVEGVGLGLPLAKYMVELHGGQLRIASELGFGTVVTMHVPVERCRAA